MDFETAYEQRKLVRKVIAKYIVDDQDHDDVEQEIWLRVHNGLGSYQKDESSLSTWLWTLSTNACLNWLRDATRQPVLIPECDIEQSYSEDDEAPEPYVASHMIEYTTPETQAMADEAAEYYETLPAQQKAVVDLLMEGLNYSEIAEQLAISESTVRVHVTRVKRALGY